MMPFHAANAATPKWVLEYIKVEKQVAEKKRLQAMLVKQINEAGSLTKTTAVVETVPTASKVGTSMLKRVNHVIRTPGGVAVGAYAVQQLLEGIGWVMEEGTYVKKVVRDVLPTNCDNTNTCEYLWYDAAGKTYPTASLACSNSIPGQSFTGWTFTSVKLVQLNNSADCLANANDGSLKNYPIHRVTASKNEDYQPPSSKIDTVPLTAGLLGAAMLGENYADPDPTFDNSKVNTGEWTAVPEAYSPDPNDIGNELYDSLESKADRAPRTNDGKPAPAGDLRYQGDPEKNDAINDRSWDDKGTKGDSTGSTTTNPETGEQTTNTEFHLPPFCSWAFTVCEWYEKWQKTDTKVNEHLDRTREHQEEEKTFWGDVKNWFDWFKTDETDKDTEVDIDEDDQIDINSTFNFSKECPASIPLVFGWNGGQLDFTFNFSMLCDVLSTYIYPIVVALGGLHAVYIVSGVRRDG